jgi:hypothetical protein
VFLLLLSSLRAASSGSGSDAAPPPAPSLVAVGGASAIAGSLRVLGPAPGLDEGSVLPRVVDPEPERTTGETGPDDTAPPPVPRPAARGERDVDMGEGIEEDALLFERRLLLTSSSDCDCTTYRGS